MHYVLVHFSIHYHEEASVPIDQKTRERPEPAALSSSGKITIYLPLDNQLVII